MPPVLQCLGLKAAASCLCTASESLFLAGSEAGQLCTFDVETGQRTFSIQLDGSGESSIGSVCSHQQQTVYAACGDSVHVLDLRAGLQPVTVHSGICTDEINQVCVNIKGQHMATADDSGMVQVMDLTAGRVLKSITDAHSNMASCLSFRPHRPWELISGGMDMTLARWDFSRGKCLDRMTVSSSSGGEEGAQMFNPPFVHALVVPTVNSNCRPWCQLVAIACGDGSVMTLDADKELETPVTTTTTTAGVAAVDSVAQTATNSNILGKGQAASGGGKTGKGKQKGKQTVTDIGSVGSSAVSLPAPGTHQVVGAAGGWVGPRRWDQQCGSHSRAAACVTYSWLGQKECGGNCAPRLLVSGGEDRRLVVWDLHTHRPAAAAAGSLTPGVGSQDDQDQREGEGLGAGQEITAVQSSMRGCGSGSGGGGGAHMSMFDITHTRKVNCMSAGLGSARHLLFVGDTGKRVSVYDLNSEVQGVTQE